MVFENFGLGEGFVLFVGVLVLWFLVILLIGWLKCNGVVFFVEEYLELVKVYLINKLFDLCGEFICGWDDGWGIDIGCFILSIQGYVMEDYVYGLLLRFMIVIDVMINFYFDEIWVNSGIDIIKRGNINDVGLLVLDYGIFKIYK